MIRKQPVFPTTPLKRSGKTCSSNVRPRWRTPTCHQRPWERVAQPVEHVTFNHGVLGSSPSALTKLSFEFKLLRDKHEITECDLCLCATQTQRQVVSARGVMQWDQNTWASVEAYLIKGWPWPVTGFHPVSISRVHDNISSAPMTDRGLPSALTVAESSLKW